MNNTQTALQNINTTARLADIKEAISTALNITVTEVETRAKAILLGTGKNSRHKSTWAYVIDVLINQINTVTVAVKNVFKRGQGFGQFVKRPGHAKHRKSFRLTEEYYIKIGHNLWLARERYKIDKDGVKRPSKCQKNGDLKRYKTKADSYAIASELHHHYGISTVEVKHIDWSDILTPETLVERWGPEKNW